MKKELLALSLLLSTQANAATVIRQVDDGEGNFRQYSIEVGQGGGCSPAVNITQVWHSDKDGPLPADAPIGYAERYEEAVERTRKVCKLDGEGKPVPAKRQELRDTTCEQVDETYTEMIPRLRENTALKLAKLAKDAQKAQAVADKAAARAACDSVKAKIKAKSRTAADLSDAINCLLDEAAK